ncbi:MgtC/SapB family protein [Clostridium rectalis]|uniref:MgtC/SapB family protein n=1 Tax=Clostridium rectalis TaxID=2040295 RepID=UPI000F63B267|nr:MgtC/SapB family protein [Clostridium rectalis]
MAIQEIVCRTLMAIIIAGIVGYERENKNRPAGFRTHILVCLGAAVISMIQIYDMEYVAEMIKSNSELASALKSDVGRLGAQVISGIGFLGAGTIIHEKGSVKGLTTAASLWAVACIGLAIGRGYYYLSIISAICVVIVLVSLKKLEDKFREKCKEVHLQVEYFNDNKEEVTHEISTYFEEQKIKIKNIEFLLEEDEIDDDKKYSQYISSRYTILMPRCTNKEAIVGRLSEKADVIKIEVL